MDFAVATAAAALSALRSGACAATPGKALMTLPGGVAGVLLALLVAVLVVVVGALLAIRAPMLESPGPGTRLALYLTTNVAQTSASPVLPELAPLVLIGSPAAALRSISIAGRELGWQDIAVDEADGQLRAVVVSALFRFRDDIVVRLRDRGAGHSEAMVRSASRVGRGDLGANVHHIMLLRRALRDRGLLLERGQ